MGGKVTKIWRTTDRLLKRKLAVALTGALPKFNYKRELFYNCRQALQDEWGIDQEVDYKEGYNAWINAITLWANKYCADLGVKEGRFWEVFAKLNVWAYYRGSCFRRNAFGKTEEILIKHDNRHQAVEDCSFIILVEKATIAEPLFEALTEKGYIVKVIALGGSPVGTYQSIAADVGDLLQHIMPKNFHIIVIHDYDMAGLLMIHKIRQWFPNTFDCGMNRHFFEYNGIEIDNRILERVTNKKFSGLPLELPEYNEEDMKLLFCPEFNLEEWETSKKKPPRPWNGKRSEIDIVYAAHGIDPFVNYIEHILEDVEAWNLKRIGVEEKELEAGENLFETHISDMEDKVGRTYALKKQECSKTYQRALEILKGTMFLPEELTELEKKYCGKLINNWTSLVPGTTDLRYSWRQREIKGMNELREKYEDEINYDWVADWSGELDERVNDKLEFWEGDILTAKKDIAEIWVEIQGKLNDAKEEDYDLASFKEEADKIEWGKDELEKIEPKDPLEEIEKAIEALEEYAKELRDA